MLATSLSHALWEIPTNAVNWPATTKPWLTATLVMDRGTPNCHLQTFEAHTATEFAAHLHLNGEPVHMLCGVPYLDAWDIRDLVSVHIGKIGGTAVVVVRDTEGCEFCPDAPGLSPSSVAEFVLVAGLIQRQRPSQPIPLVSLALTVHYLAAQKATTSATVA